MTCGRSAGPSTHWIPLTRSWSAGSISRGSPSPRSPSDWVSRWARSNPARSGSIAGWPGCSATSAKTLTEPSPPARRREWVEETDPVSDDNRINYLAGEPVSALDPAERADLDDLRALLAEPSV